MTHNPYDCKDYILRDGELRFFYGYLVKDFLFDTGERAKHNRFTVCRERGTGEVVFGLLQLHLVKENKSTAMVSCSLAPEEALPLQVFLDQLRRPSA